MIIRPSHREPGEIGERRTIVDNSIIPSRTGGNGERWPHRRNSRHPLANRGKTVSDGPIVEITDIPLANRGKR